MHYHLQIARQNSLAIIITYMWDRTKHRRDEAEEEER
jgi:hypothetical protein